MKIFILILNLFVYIEISYANSKPNKNIESLNRIVGGNQIPDEKLYPYMVSVRIRGYHYCGGTLYKDHYVITAAHCVVNIIGRPSSRIKGKITVNAATKHHEIRGVLYDIEEIHVHPLYKTIFHMVAPYDIAILKIKPSDFLGKNVDIQSVELYRNENLPIGTEVIVLGWGLTGLLGSLSSKLKFAYMEIAEPSSCHNFYNTDQTSILCLKSITNEKNSVCGGDSGSPVIYNNQLLGITSFGDIFCSSIKPQAFMNVTYFVDWIDDIAK